MILLAALLCNYGRELCLIDVGTEGYVHVRQEAQDRAMEEFEAQSEAQNISAQKRWSGFGPVDSAENRENGDLAGTPGKV